MFDVSILDGLSKEELEEIFEKSIILLKKRKEKKITINEAFEILKPLEGMKFKDFMPIEQIKNINKTDKGSKGKAIEKLIGIKASSDLIDFTDGELKTTDLAETIAITQLSSMIEEIIERTTFENSRVYNKIKKILFVIVNEDEPLLENNYIQKIIFLNLENNKFMFNELKKQYIFITNEIINIVENTHNLLHTINGKGSNRAGKEDFIQIRTKDSKDKNGYHPIYYNTKKISDKNYAFYFTGGFKKYICNL